ncbi:hypothetical protein HYH34_17325, partial [Clostridium botulinum]
SDDYYIYDERRLSLIGEASKNIYRLGDTVKIKVSKVDLFSHEIYFDIIKDDEEDKEEVEFIEETEKYNTNL